jgi:hypothetical protein
MRKETIETMRLNMPKLMTWWIGVIVGVVGVIFYIIHTSPFATLGFVLVAVAWLLLVLGNYVKGL